jgi:hypothetical protein
VDRDQRQARQRPCRLHQGVPHSSPEVPCANAPIAAPATGLHHTVGSASFFALVIALFMINHWCAPFRIRWRLHPAGWVCIFLRELLVSVTGTRSRIKEGQMTGHGGLAPESMADVTLKRLPSRLSPGWSGRSGIDAGARQASVAGARCFRSRIPQARAWGERASGCTGKPLARQPDRPPSRGRTRAIPFRSRASATRALVASLGQEQKRTISTSRGISKWRCSSSSAATRRAPGIV